MTDRLESCAKPPELVRACGLVAFAWISFSAPTAPKRAIALMIVINGLMCHLTRWNACRRIDIAVNLILVLAVNLTSQHQPRTLTVTLFALLVWIASHGKSECAWMHVLGIQWVLAHEYLHW